MANTKGGNYVALLSVCTHAGGSMGYRVSQNDFLCLEHGGQFKTDGSVKLPSPKQPMPTYTVILNADGNTLHGVG